MNPKNIIYLVLFLVGLFAARYYIQYKNHSSIEGGDGLQNKYSHLGGDFILQHHSGPFTLKDIKGKPSVLYFGFASCPDVCPLSLTKLNKVLDKIGPEAHKKINKVFISVDYKRDTPKLVNEYALHFGKDFIGLAGTKEQIDQITKAYAVYYKFVPLEDSNMGYTVDHTSRFFVLDPRGKIINSFSDITNDPAFKILIKELTGL